MPRLIDMKIEPFLIVSTIKVIVGQRLVRKLDAQKEKYLLTPAEMKSLGKSVDLDRIFKILKEENIIDSKISSFEEIPFYRPKSSTENPEGYKSRIGIHEVLKMSPAIKDLIIENADSAKIEEQAKKEGMMTMIEDGIFKAVQGTTSIEEILRVISE